MDQLVEKSEIKMSGKHRKRLEKYIVSLVQLQLVSLLSTALLIVLVRHFAILYHQDKKIKKEERAALFEKLA